jgi:hypothetical protein
MKAKRHSIKLAVKILDPTQPEHSCSSAIFSDTQPTQNQINSEMLMTENNKK